MYYSIRTNQDILYKSFETNYISAVLGARRVGKSTLVENYAKLHDGRCWAFFNMDIRAERLQVEQEQLHDMIEAKAKIRINQGKKIWVVIDEAQKCPILFEQIKVIYDRYKHNHCIKFILTGSGFLLLHQMSAETLAGRIQLLHLREFGLREVSHLLNPETNFPEQTLLVALLQQQPLNNIQETIAEQKLFKSELQNALNHELIWGGLPEMIECADNVEKTTYLSDYLQTYLEKDIREISSISNINLYQNMMELIAEQTGSVRDDTKLVEVLQCSRDTLKKYRGYLLATLMYEEVYPYIKASFKRLVKTPKAYLNNNGLVSYLTNIYDIAILKKSGLIGHRFENCLLKELSICLDRNPGRAKIYFWRTHQGVEIDFVIDMQTMVYPIEVTVSNKIDQKKVKNLQLFLENTNNTPYGIYIYNGEFLYDAEKRIYFIPIWGI